MIDQRTAPYAALVMRLALGVMFLAHAYLKVVVFTIPGTVQFFESVGFPGYLAYVVIAGEFLAGVALLAGWKTRLVALATMPILLGAVWTHSGNGWVFSAPNGGWEYPLFLTVAAGVTALLGEGAYAVSSVLRKSAVPAVA